MPSSKMLSLRADFDQGAVQLFQSGSLLHPQSIRLWIHASFGLGKGLPCSLMTMA